MSRRQPYAPAIRAALRLFIGLVAAVMLPAGGSQAMLAEEPLTVSLRPSAVSAVVGDTVQVDVRVENAIDVVGAELLIRFDPRVLQVVDADGNPANGVQISAPGTFWGGRTLLDCPACNQVDNAAGEITYAAALFESSVGVSGSGTLATIQFHVRACGQSDLAFDPTRTQLPFGPAHQPSSAHLIDGRVSGFCRSYLPAVRNRH